MSLIHCTCACIYQKEGYCELEKAAEISSGPNDSDCLHFKPIQQKSVSITDKSESTPFT